MSVAEEGAITSKGQVTIPKRIREKLGLSAGTEVEFILAEDGTLRLQPKEPALEQLRAVKEHLSDHDVDIETMRRESKRDWSSHLDGTDT